MKLELFPAGKHEDAVDATTGAVARLMVAKAVPHCLAYLAYTTECVARHGRRLAR